MGRLFFVVLAGVAGAALLHIIIILAIPSYADRDVWTRINALGPADFFHILPPNKADGLTSANPFMRSAVCRFEISDEAVRISASGLVHYWSLAIFDPAANEIYSMNERTATDKKLDIAVVTPLQMIEFRKNLPEALEDTVLIEFPRTTGYVVLRTVAPDASWNTIVKAFLNTAQCGPLSSY